MNILVFPTVHVDKIAKPSSVTADEPEVETRTGPSAAPHIWKELFDGLVEVVTGEPTRFGTGTGILSCIDRCFVSLPPWALYTMHLHS